MGMAEMGVSHAKIPIRALIAHLKAQIIPRNPIGSANTLQSAISVMKLGHIAKHCPRLHFAEPTANYVATSPATNPKWLIDYGASHNITGDLANLSIHSEYDDTDEVVIGDSLGQDHGGGSTQRRV
ncbi:hypothetical protein CK203_115949 [Vitis vinifera]|uniref:Uncharacterized protein n=1 Tax=Vitis vinifera TaxID=29760 RepID=A0A438C8M7_VITVI|nr:hypothetical protein CK203_115949 [Vitis vinifera]